MTARRLTLDLIPSTCWYSNLRTTLPRNTWDFLRRQQARFARQRCEICGGQGQHHVVECHERWAYDDEKKVQRLVGLISLCPPCHEVKHFGFAAVRGREAQALRHYCAVNQVSESVARKEIQAEFALWEQRSRHKWDLDVSWLLAEGIDTQPVIEASRREAPNG